MEIDFNTSKPILIAGPTASGKSALGIKLARKYDGVIINADALQIYKEWQVLTARPDDSETSQCPHWMYGHIGIGSPYSSGHWVNEVKAKLKDAQDNKLRPIILGGTGLNFQMLTNGIAPVPEIPDHVKREADQIEMTKGRHAFVDLLATSDPETLARVDAQNPMRVRRAWEVFTATGKGLSKWQDETPPPLLALKDCTPIKLVCDTVWLNERIDRRFDMMIDQGALDECRSVLDAGLWDEGHPSCRAIGARELIGHLQNNDDLADAIEEAKQQTRRYAKRQRTWFRSKMVDWHSLYIDDPDTVIQL